MTATAILAITASAVVFFLINRTQSGPNRPAPSQPAIEREAPWATEQSLAAGLAEALRNDPVFSELGEAEQEALVRQTAGILQANLDRDVDRLVEMMKRLGGALREPKNATERFTRMWSTEGFTFVEAYHIERSFLERPTYVVRNGQRGILRKGHLDSGSPGVLTSSATSIFQFPIPDSEIRDNPQRLSVVMPVSLVDGREGIALLEYVWGAELKGWIPLTSSLEQPGGMNSHPPIL